MFDFDRSYHKMAQSALDSISFPNEEEKIYQFWKDIDAFRTSVKLSKGRPRQVHVDAEGSLGSLFMTDIMYLRTCSRDII